MWIVVLRKLFVIILLIFCTVYAAVFMLLFQKYCLNI